MFLPESSLDGATKTLARVSSIRDVTYGCGYCGYDLNLSSSYRNTDNIGSKYGKAIRKGVVSFLVIDESRFTQSDELSCLPYFSSKHSWGLFRKKTRLLCRKCGNHVGSAYDEDCSSELSDDPNSSSGSSGSFVRKKYNIKIGALQPSLDESGTLLSP